MRVRVVTLSETASLLVAPDQQSGRALAERRVQPLLRGYDDMRKLTNFPRKLVLEYWDCGQGHLHPTAEQAVACMPIHDPVLDWPVSDLCVTRRSTNALIAANIKTIGDLLNLTYAEFSRLKLGVKSREEIMDVVYERGLRFRET